MCDSLPVRSCVRCYVCSIALLVCTPVAHQWQCYLLRRSCLLLHVWTLQPRSRATSPAATTSPSPASAARPRHRVLHEPEDAPRRAVRAGHHCACGPCSALMQICPYCRAPVQLGGCSTACGLRALLVGVYKLLCTLLVSALALSVRHSYMVLHLYSYSSWGVSTERRGTSPQDQAARDLG